MQERTWSTAEAQKADHDEDRYDDDGAEQQIIADPAKGGETGMPEVEHEVAHRLEDIVGIKPEDRHQETGDHRQDQEFDENAQRRVAEKSVQAVRQSLILPRFHSFLR